MQIGVDGAKVPGEVQFEIDTGRAVILFTVPLGEEQEFVTMVQNGFDEARQVQEDAHAGNGS